MSAALVRYGWKIAFQPQLFARQYTELKAEVKRLKLQLSPTAFLQHPQVKLLAAVMAGIKEPIAADPVAGIPTQGRRSKRLLRRVLTHGAARRSSRELGDPQARAW